MKLETRDGIVLTEPKARRSGPPTLEKIKEIMRETDFAIFPVSGDCLEGAGVLDGGWVAIDFTSFPAPPRLKNRGGDGSTDLCLCYATFPGTRTPAVMLKEYCGVWGPWQMVGTRYNLGEGSKHRMNCAMEAKEILGVVFASWAPGGTLLWKRDPDSFSDKLETTPTIHGGNCGDPMPFHGGSCENPAPLKRADQRGAGSTPGPEGSEKGPAGPSEGVSMCQAL